MLFLRGIKGVVSFFSPTPFTAYIWEVVSGIREIFLSLEKSVVLNSLLQSLITPVGFCCEALQTQFMTQSVMWL